MAFSSLSGASADVSEFSAFEPTFERFHHDASPDILRERERGEREEICSASFFNVTPLVHEESRQLRRTGTLRRHGST
jgi:hypothetical protein